MARVCARCLSRETRQLLHTQLWTSARPAKKCVRFASCLASDLNQNEPNKSQVYFNSIGIQMIPNTIYRKIFGPERENFCDQAKIDEVNKSLMRHGLKTKNKLKSKSSSSTKVPPVDEYLPELEGKDLDEHYWLLGDKYTKRYKELARRLIDCQLPPMPSQWRMTEGWTRYSLKDGHISAEAVDYPLEQDLAFDVEVCMNDSGGRIPTLATAMSSQAWYSWCSRRLLSYQSSLYFNQMGFCPQPRISDMIPMGQSFDKEKLIIGHNVSFDRSYIKEQYLIDADKTRFMDTLSLHMCISGLTQHQRTLSYSQKIRAELQEKSADVKPPNGENLAELWNGVGSLNNIVDVYKLYCNDNMSLSKDPRKVFEKGTLKEVFEDFQQLMTYCAADVIATLEIFKKVLPIFSERFPHPVTLAGMLELSTMYLPVNIKKWNRYVTEAQSIYDDQERELNLSLREIANDACKLLYEKKYAQDVWLWDLDWFTPKIRFKKEKPIPKKRLKEKEAEVDNTVDYLSLSIKETSLITKSVINIFSTARLLRKIQPLFPGYPRWYAEFCSKRAENEQDNEDWESGPHLISTQMRSVPKLMRLLWGGYPLHFDLKHGWGYLKPDDCFLDDVDEVPVVVEEGKEVIYFPLKKFKDIVRETQFFKTEQSSSIDVDEVFFNYEKEALAEEVQQEQIKPIKDIIPGCLFYKLPHKGGPSKRVGNPLGKDFLKKVEDGTMTAYHSDIASFVLKQSKTLSYWKNASKRILSQLVISEDDQVFGAILPRVIVAGTVTRRAVEPTWLTASNAYEDRLGSELKGLVQCPEGYNLVGADVDSQELWIASLLGDATLAKIHGCTGIGWMTLQGSKANGTDMHSKTAQSINISRDQAKVLNYARIYGSGQPFATRFLMQSNPGLRLSEAKVKAKKIFIETKGNRRRVVPKEDSKKFAEVVMDGREDENLMLKKYWVNGTESHMFNKLEEIANSSEPRTPVLGCRISRALEPQVVQSNYINSRINWVVQSSAVDFLHLMLVTMKWLMEMRNIRGRFAISIHDELRYLIKSEDKYEAALALQISNLLTRAFFAYKLGLKDLPLSVAFFSSVEIDKCLRKEVSLDCKTPSNPLGLRLGYGIPFGESLDIFQLLKKLKKIEIKLTES